MKVTIDKIAAEDRLRACDAIHTALYFLLAETKETDSDAIRTAISVQLEYLEQELSSLRAILLGGSEAPSEPASDYCFCRTFKKLQAAGLT
jgi:hypothetical protein